MAPARGAPADEADRLKVGAKLDVTDIVAKGIHVLEANGKVVKLLGCAPRMDQPRPGPRRTDLQGNNRDTEEAVRPPRRRQQRRTTC